jgi:hypothetical protein
MEKHPSIYVAIFGEEKKNNAVAATKKRMSPSLTTSDPQRLGQVVQWKKGRSSAA